jgi:hypothetical protein
MPKIKNALREIKIHDPVLWSEIVDAVKQLSSNNHLVYNDRLKHAHDLAKRYTKIQGIVIVRPCIGYPRSMDSYIQRGCGWIFGFRGAVALPVFHCKNRMYLNKDTEKLHISPDVSGLALNRDQMYTLMDTEKQELIQWHEKCANLVVHGEHNIYIPKTQYNELLIIDAE